jgi:hypothetical protein
MFAGFALGPILSSLLLTYAHQLFPWMKGGDPTQVVLVPFYFALTAHLVYLALLTVGLPESLSLDRREASRKRHEEEVEERSEVERKGDERAKEQGQVRVWTRRVLVTVGMAFGFLRPLALLLPKKRPEGEEEEQVEELRANIDWGKDLKQYWNPEDVWKHTEDGDTATATGGGRDWSLTKIAVGCESPFPLLPLPLSSGPGA